MADDGLEAQKLPPQAIEAEMAVLGSMMLDKQAAGTFLRCSMFPVFIDRPIKRFFDRLELVQAERTDRHSHHCQRTAEKTRAGRGGRRVLPD